ncbi:MAG: hypothetical protein AB7J32_25170 [Pseudonocardia sp.]
MRQTTTRFDDDQVDVDVVPLQITKVEVRIGDGAFTAAAPQGGSLGNWNVTLPVPGGQPQRTVTARMTFKTGTSGTATDTRTDAITLITDGSGPTITIGTPQAGALVPLPGLEPGAQKVIPVAGAVVDTQSGVLKVEVAGPSKAFTPAGFAAATGQWNTSVTITPPLGVQTIQVRATDKRGNQTVVSVAVDAALQIGSLDPASTADYLGDLLFFADLRLTGTISPALLEAAFNQRFDAARAADQTAVASAPVHHARIAAEILRSYLAKRLGATPPASVAAARDHADRRFLRAAYHAMLRELGTSDTELRTARTAPDTVRAALAGRLGLDSLTIAELDAIALNPDTVTGAALEQVYGILDPTRDPYLPAVVPLVLDRRLIRLRSRWQREDEQVGTPVVDPDVVTPGDVVENGTASALLAARRGQIAAAAGTLRNQLTQQLGQAGSTHAAALAAALNTVLGQAGVAELDAIAAVEPTGADIGSRLAALHLDLAAFRRLHGIRALAATNAVRDAEWNDVVAILVQVRKRRDFSPAWRQEERAAALVLAPGEFKIGARPVPLDTLPAFLTTARARVNWEATLRGRQVDEHNTRESFVAAVAAAEAATLPALRDDLVGVVAGAASPPQTAEAVRDRLGDELLLDFASSGTALTTRRDQAIDTLQSILFAVRTRRLSGLAPLLGQFPTPAANTWTLDLAAGFTETSFDEEWRWMGAYASWRAAMSAFVWPENVLAPTLRKIPATPPAAGQDVAGFATGAFRALAGRLRTTSNLTPAQARAEGQAYLQELRAEFPGKLPTALTSDAKVQITELLTDAQLAERRDKLLASAAVAGQPNPGQDHALFLPVPAGTPTFNTTFGNTKVWLAEVFMFVPMLIAGQLAKSGQHLAALSWVRTVYAYDLPVDKRRIYRGLVLEDRPEMTNLVRSSTWLLTGLNAHDVAQTRPNSHTRATILTLARLLLSLADTEFIRETPESLTRARLLYDSVIELLDRPELVPLANAQGVRLPDNPVLAALGGRAAAGLSKLRNGLTALGRERGGSRRPTPFRYATLVDRANRLVATAQQVEASFLSALEKADAEEYNLLKAQQDIRVAEAGVTLQGLRVEEAQAGVTGAELGRDRAVVGQDHFQELLDEGTTGWEKAALAGAALSAGLQLVSAFIPAPPGATGGVSPFGAFAGAASSLAAAASTKASFERREQDWRFQLALAEQDVALADQQIVLAGLHAGIVGQEKLIAELQRDNARATLSFLANKFTNAELFDWMSDVLSEVYRFFLQQATLIAQLAERQLRFERQEELPEFIRAEYWEPPGDSGVDRRGLTGAEQLLRDLTRLDQYAFSTDRRRLQLSKTFSLAALDPVAFRRFQQTGLLVFATPAELFDRDFPGHYARLVKRVSTSVIALIPPVQGIRATLTGGASSRVVVPTEPGFSSVVIPHGAESVALSSPKDATGLFALDAQPELRPPFDGIGVDTVWQLRLPVPANPFDFETLVDVLFTLDYTALDSAVLRDQVVRTLDMRLSLDRAFSVRNDLPDQWYDLNNPAQSATPMRVRFRAGRADFPPNVDDLVVQQVGLLVPGAEDVPVTVEELRLVPAGGGQPVVSQGPGTTVGGIVSTRRDNGSGWRPLIGASPVGDWELALPDDDPQLQMLLKEETITDLMVVITVSGRGRPWPT